MKTRQTLLLCGLGVATFAAMWFAACADKYQTPQILGHYNTAAQPGTSPTTSPLGGPWSPVGSGRNSLGLSESLLSQDFSRSYEIDLGNALQQSGQYGLDYNNDGLAPDARDIGGAARLLAGSPVNPAAASDFSGELDRDARFQKLQQQRDELDRNFRALQEERSQLIPLLGDIPLTGNLFVSRDGTPSTTVAPSWAKSALSAANTEVWVIAKPPQPVIVDDGTPGAGCLYTTLTPDVDPYQKKVLVPLEHTDVKASIVGHVSGVEVTQRFHNPYSGKIEAVYVFPLPENAAVSEFVMTIGDRHIRGIIRDRAEAEQIYTQARSQGYVASLMTQERANIFTQKVANIEPDKTIDVSVTYFGPLTYSDGAFEFVFPMVIGPRFNPPGTHDGVGAVGNGSSGASGQATEVSYLRPNERSGADIGVTVNIDAGMPIARIESVNHAVDTQRRGDNGAIVTLSRNDTLPNKDFVLRVHVAGDRVRSTLLTQADDRDPSNGFFNLLIVPPKSLESVARGPVEMVFVLDCSGSMGGRPIEQAKEAIERGLARMQRGDSFQIVNFSNSAGQLGNRPLDATPDNIRRGREYVAQLNSEGGTYMVEGIRAALGFPSDDLRPRYVAFLTDGFIGNEDDVLRNLYQGLGASRVFSFGVGSAPNRALMDSMARMGRGAAAYLSLNDSSGEVMDQFFDHVSHAAMTNVHLDTGAGSGQIGDIYPSRIPDLFVGRPVVIVGRYTGGAPTSLTVRGRCGGQDVSVTADGAIATTALARKAIPKMWARARLTELAEAAVIQDRPVLAAATRQTALDFCLMSPFTAFVAVDSSRRTEGTFGTTVPVAVPVPAGTRYENTVQEGR